MKFFNLGWALICERSGEGNVILRDGGTERVLRSVDFFKDRGDGV